MKRKYYLLIVALIGLSYFFFFALTSLRRLAAVCPQYDVYSIVSLFVSVLIIGILLGNESRMSFQIEWQRKFNWTKFIFVAIPALLLCLYNLIPYFLTIPSFEPLPRDFSMVMGVVAGYALATS